MLPEWMRSNESYVPPKEGGTFAIKTIIAMGRVMAGVKVQAGHEKERHLPAVAKLFLLLGIVVAISACTGRLTLMAIGAVILLYLSTWPAIDLWGIIRPALFAALFVLVLFTPAMIMNPQGAANNVTVAAKVFLCVAAVGIFNHTTQWNHITTALRRLHIPGIFVFTLDITLKYIVLLGALIVDLLTSMQLRAVGRHNKKYSSLGGVLGVTFIRGVEMNGEMYEAMRCRGFTDDYRGL